MRLLRSTSMACCLALATTAASAQAHRHRKTDDAPAAARVPEKPFPFGATWLLTSLNGKPALGEAPSFILDDKLRATGFSGCNSFSLALYPIKDQKLAAGAIALTHKTCDAATMASEHAFLLGLHSLPTWSVSIDGVLTLKGATGVMLFRRGV